MKTQGRFKWVVCFVVGMILAIIAFNCSPNDNAKYKRIVNKGWIQDSSHSLLTVYSFEFEDYVGKSFKEFLADFPDSLVWNEPVDGSNLNTLIGWHLRYSDRSYIDVYFESDPKGLISKQLMPSWKLENARERMIRHFEVSDLINANFVFPRKYDKLNREIED